MWRCSKRSTRWAASTRATPLLGYTVNHREVQPLLTYLQDNLHLDAPLVRQIGCVIGTHTGPGAFGIAFFDKELVLNNLLKKQVGQPAAARLCFYSEK